MRAMLIAKLKVAAAIVAVTVAVGAAGGGVIAAKAAEAGTVKIGDIEIPADCALAKNERPRLLFRGSDLPKYKARIAGPMKADFESYKAYWDAKIAEKGYDWKDSNASCAEGVCLGVLYQLTGDRKYAEAVRRSSAFKAGSVMWGHAFALDLVFDAMPKEEIDAQFGLFMKDADKKYQYGTASYCLWPAIVFYGSDPGRDQEIASLLAKGLGEAKNGHMCLAFADEWAKNRGGDVNSFSYIGNHSVIKLTAHLTAISNALGEDAWGNSLWARHLCSYYVYHFFPWTDRAIHFDNTRDLNEGPTAGDFGATYLLAAAPARYRDGRYQAWIDSLLVREDPNATGWAKTERHMQVMGGLWGRILWRDPEIPALEPKEFPPSRFFLTRGAASMRENWSKDATFIHFRCGQFGDLGDGRHNIDNNTFTIYKKGILALDTGPAHNLDLSRLKFNPPNEGANYTYTPQTIAHNGILVYHADANPQGPGGGQDHCHAVAEWSKARGRPITERNMGIPLAWETSPEYDYVAGDAANSYNPVAVASFTRQLVYVRPDLVFVFDRVETARDGCKTTWLLHTADKPKIDGAEKPDTRIHPDGHFLWEGSTVTVTDMEMGGRMFAKMLLPEKREIRLLGGENHEFELPYGKNCGPTPETYKIPPTDWAVQQSRVLGEGLRGWRIEVEDRSGSRSVRFLNVIQTCDKGTTKMVPCVSVQKDGMLGARVESGGATVEVLFSNSGALGGRITVEKGGKKLVDRALAAGIEDNYDRWKGDPDYQKWTTDPFRRSVVLGKTP